MRRRCCAAVRLVLSDGLGNQLFQYAAARSMADELGLEMVVTNPDVANPLLLAALGDEPFQTSVRSASRGRLFANGVRLARAVGLSNDVAVVHQSPAQCFDARGDARSLAKPDGVWLRGYFQHPTWFSGSIEPIARRVYVWLTGQMPSDLSSDTLVISFRRGDYVRLGWDLSVDYYLSALSHARHHDGPVVVVGDDQLFNALVADWLQARGHDAAVAPLAELRPEIRDAVLLASAASVTMSNSTFCWWAVAARHFARVRPQHVMTPSRWMPYLDSNPLALRGWQRVDAAFGTEPRSAITRNVRGRPVSRSTTKDVHGPSEHKAVGQ
jgi:hypothetical protein